MINGDAHGPEVTTTCQLHMRSFTDGETITIEPWRSDAFPVVKDLVVDRGAFDRIIQAGGYVSVNTGSAPEAHSVPVPKDDADRAFNVATCIGCGACVAACPNGSASLFMGAKVTHLGLLPQGQPERDERVVNMVAQHDHEGFGGCTNIGACTAACPKEIPLDVISPAQQGPAHRDQARSLSDVLPHDEAGRPASPGLRPRVPRAVRQACSARRNLLTHRSEGRPPRRAVREQLRRREPASLTAVGAARRTTSVRRMNRASTPLELGGGPS